MNTPPMPARNLRRSSRSGLLSLVLGRLICPFSSPISPFHRFVAMDVSSGPPCRGDLPTAHSRLHCRADSRCRSLVDLEPVRQNHTILLERPFLTDVTVDDVTAHERCITQPSRTEAATATCADADDVARFERQRARFLIRPLIGPARIDHDDIAGAVMSAFEAPGWTFRSLHCRRDARLAAQYLEVPVVPQAAPEPTGAA